jgi:outer membrane protein assembly factor BamD (BamD/ComL family)
MTKRRKQVLLIGLAVLAAAGVAQGQRKTKKELAGYDRAARATVVHPAIVYVAAEDNASHLSEVLPGHEVVVMEHNGSWVRVFANTDAADEQGEADKPEFSADDNATPESGWIKDKGLVNPATPNGDAILFGTAANFEAMASQPHAPKDAAEEAHLLYRRVVEYFPNSQLAPEAAYRSADVRWQIDRADVRTLPSAKEQEAYLRQPIYDGEMKKVIKQYPNSKYAALAEWDMIDNKLCGDWQGLPKCPEMESGLYQKYADRYPDSPKAAQALYEATYRQGVLVSMYRDDDRKRAQQAANNTQSLASQMKQRYPQSDYTARAASIAFRVQQDVPIYGNDRE